MAVFGIRGRRVGVVRVVHADCFEVQRLPEDGGELICIKAEALFTVDSKDGVTLVCAKEDIGRYTHEAHPPEPAGRGTG